MIHKLDNLMRVAKWLLNIPMIILCVDEFKKALRALRTDDIVKKNPVSKINFALGVVFTIAYIPNVYLRQTKSCLFLVAAWLCLYSVSNRMRRLIERYAKIGDNNYNNWTN